MKNSARACIEQIRFLETSTTSQHKAHSWVQREIESFLFSPPRFVVLTRAKLMEESFMKRTNITLGLVSTVALFASAGHAQEFLVTGGQTNVLLDTATLSAAASLDLSSVSADVIAPGELGAGSVAFGINSRSSAIFPTTFAYDAGLAAFSGSIEHAGSVFFNDDAVEVGNFTIGYDAGRVGDSRSGFFVESTVGIAAILFDIESPSSLVAESGELSIEANLLVSSEFAGFLSDNGLASADLTGADVGDALVSAVPAPSSALALGVFGLLASRRRR
jgi:hypothetical protein